MITSGFFESVGTDRQYGVDDFNAFFEGLITPNGIFNNVGGGFVVTPSGNGNLQINIADGKALVNNHWVRSDAIEVLTLDAAHNLFDRYDMITLRWNKTTRNITLEVTKGTPSSANTRPEPIKTTNQYEIVLAYVCVKANTKSISDLDVVDCRFDSDVCGVIATLINDVSTSGLYRQFAAHFQKLVESMETWQEEQKRAYNEWFDTLTSNLTVDNHLTREKVNFLTTRADGTQYINVPDTLGYVDGDILDVYYNGVLLVEGVDYDLTMNEVENIPMIFIYTDVPQGNMITFYCTKSVIG